LEDEIKGVKEEIKGESDAKRREKKEERRDRLESLLLALNERLLHLMKKSGMRCPEFSHYVCERLCCAAPVFAPHALTVVLFT
jgi:hypothetical protein